MIDILGKNARAEGRCLLSQTVDAIDAALGGEVAHAAEGLVGGAAATGAGGGFHLAFGVLVHCSV